MLCLSTSYADCIRYCADTGYLITLFASARPTRIASRLLPPAPETKILCLSTSYADCIFSSRFVFRFDVALPQHVLRGLHHVLTYAMSIHMHFASARPTRIASRDVSLTPCSTSFASARPTRIASPWQTIPFANAFFASARPTRIASAKTDCYFSQIASLPQHVLRGLHHS